MEDFIDFILYVTAGILFICIGVYFFDSPTQVKNENQIPIIEVELLDNQIKLSSHRGESFVTVIVDSLLREYQLVQEGTVFLCCENYCE